MVLEDRRAMANQSRINEPTSNRSKKEEFSLLSKAIKTFINLHFEKGMSIPHRAAAALNYFAEVHPEVYIPYNYLYQAAAGVSRLPPSSSPEVLTFQTRMNAIGNILHDKYGRGKDSVRGVGVRACVDTLDRVTTEGYKRARAIECSIDKYDKVLSAINVKDIPNTPQNKEARDWVIANKKNMISLQASKVFLKGLLPGSTDKK